MNEVNGQNLRQVLLEVIESYSQRGHSFQSQTVLKEVVERLKIGNNLEMQQALLTYWQDLFRTGHIAWGYNIDNINPPFCHLTEHGRKALENLSRDPLNPDGYLAFIRTTFTINQIAESYLNEAIKVYNADCYKASAVMIGAAAESIILEIRDSIINKLNNLEQNVPSNLEDWRIKRVLEAIQDILNTRINNMPNSLRDSFSSYWSAFTQQIRAARNEAGHPSSIEPISLDTVHASLLIFPELCRLANDLNDWINNHFE
ncbi:MAG: hypothetical protein JW976_09315 [Syntrophaceae bacterium]|nr:hypothetical protein [Syntrophaceae bacterium]